MARVDQSRIQGKIRDMPIAQELERVLENAAEAAGVDEVRVTSGGQPGSTGRRTGSTRHDAGRAADLELLVSREVLTFTDQDGGPIVEDFVRAAAASGATGIGAGLGYMGNKTIHVGFGTSPQDHSKLVWGAGGKSANAPRWLRQAALDGWNNPAAAVAGTSGPVLAAPGARRFVVMARDGLRLRAGPGLEFEKTRTVRFGTEVTVLGFDGAAADWARVDLEDDGLADGHMFAAFLMPANGESEEEIDEPGEEVIAERAPLTIRSGVGNRPAENPVEFAGPGKPLTQDALDEAAAIVGIPEAAMWAVLHVESSGAGYLADRRPKVLFERHLFHRATGGRFDRTHPDISQRTAGGYGAGGAHQYDRLASALTLNRTAALASASWGLGQVLGSNFAVAGFADVEKMVSAMVQSERQQLLAMFKFIEGNNLGVHLKNQNWLKFALRYNGPNAEANGYPQKLEAAFDIFSAGNPPDIRVRIAQLALTFLGHRPGGVDGLFGNNTRRALQAFQRAEGMAQTTELTDADFDALIAKAFDGKLDD